MSTGPPPVPGGRTREEREAVRREREARRATGDGGAPPRAGAADSAASRSEAVAAASDGEGPRPPEAGRPAPGGEPPRKSRGPRLVGLAVVVALLGATAWVLASLFQPFAGDGGRAIRVAVPKGATVGQIGDLLSERGVIPSAFFFQARARLSGVGGDLKPGSYKLREDMSYGAVLGRLEKGPPQNIVTVVIPEGRSRREVARELPGGLEGSYLRETRRSDQLDLRRYRATAARSLEGFLFPATYELRRGRPVSALVDQQLAAFRLEFAKVDLRYARSKNLTPYDVLIIASMVEREAQVAKERPLVASVIYNRLHEGIPLSIDATIRYATRNWQRPLRESELHVDSPYNTRTHEGLPPGPIGNPGLASIRAAAHPARTKLLYYVVKPGTCGEHAFSANDSEFQRDAARYERERRERGGKSPTSC